MVVVAMGMLVLRGQAQSGEVSLLAGADGLGRKGSSLWGSTAYPASLSGKSMLGSGGEKRFLSDLILLELALSGTVAKTPFLLRIGREGNSYLSRNRVQLALAQQIHERLSISARVGYRALIARSYPSRHHVDVGLGAVFHCSDGLNLGFQADGINSFFVKEAGREYKIRAGAGIKLSDMVLLTVEGIKEQQRAIGLLFAIHYHFYEQAFTRIGYSSQLNSFLFSMGYSYKGLDTEITSTYHLGMGLSAGVLLIYHFIPSK